MASQAQAYRAGLLARQRWTDRLGWLLPGVGAQAVLHWLAATDLPAQLAYQDRTAQFHAEIREFYYGYLFNERPFGAADFARRPVFQGAHVQPALPLRTTGGLPALGALLLVAGARQLKRLRV